MSIYGKTPSRAAFARLFSETGEAYGAGDGSTTFSEPDLRGRKPIGLDNQGGVSANRVTDAAADTLGGAGGNESVQDRVIALISILEEKYILDPANCMNPYLANNAAVKFI
jgi:hypothetical protein